MVSIDKEWSENKLDCSVIIRGLAYLDLKIFYSVKIGDSCV
jgi:hypothetical protein